MDISPNFTYHTSNGCELQEKIQQVETHKNIFAVTVFQDKLSNLAILSIENDIAKSLNFSNSIKKFASIKARKAPI